jgi:predicted PurR-regulated permease PerM
MNTISRNVIILLAIILGLYLLWFFSLIVTYIIVASVLALIGRPLILFLDKLQIAGFKIPKWLSALLTLLLLWFFVIGFFRLFIPVIVSEAGQLSTVDINIFFEKLKEPVKAIERIYRNFNLTANELDFETSIKNRLSSVLNISILSGFFGYMATLLGDVFIAIFSISFISFFLLKEEDLLTKILITFIPEDKELQFRRAIDSVKHLISRYLIGVLLQVSGIMILVSAGMMVAGLTFKQSLLIGLLASMLNIVPYLGPLIGTLLGVLLGMAFNIQVEMSALILLGGYILIVFLIVQGIDNFIFQPVIFSKSVLAHPLEIFIVIMMASSIAGIPGMILAIPAYTILRVFAKEFFNNFRVVKKLTGKI